MPGYPQHLVILDYETLGLDEQVHEPIEIGAVLLDKDSLEEKASFYSKMKPQRPEAASPFALKVHGYGLAEGRDPVDVLREQFADAPEAIDVMYAFEEAMFGDRFDRLSSEERRMYRIAGQNTKFDFAFAREIYRKAGLDPNRLPYHTLDLQDICFYLAGIGSIQLEGNSTSLDPQVAMFNIPRSEHHNALEDCRLVAEVLRRYHQIGLERERAHQLISRNPALLMLLQDPSLDLSTLDLHLELRPTERARRADALLSDPKDAPNSSPGNRQNL